MIECTITEGKPPVQFLTLAEVAKKVHKSSFALKKLIYKGVLPEANFRAPKAGIIKEGARLYSKDFIVPLLIPVLKEITQGKKISQEVKGKLFSIFMQEQVHFKDY